MNDQIPLIAILIFLATLSPTLAQEEIDYYSYLENASNYLLSHYNSGLGLIYESEDLNAHFLGNPNQYFNNTYWLYSDNYLCSFALKRFSPLVAQNISQTIKELREKYNLPKSGLYEALFGEEIPIHIMDSNKVLVETDSSNLYYIFADIYNGTNEITDWYDYGDLLCYQALNYYWKNIRAKAEECFYKACNMFDGKGVYDKQAQIDGYYANYKVALLIYTAKVIGANVDLQPLKRKLLDFQAQNGGIIALSDLNGTIIGYPNAETTAFWLLALDDQLVKEIKGEVRVTSEAVTEVISSLTPKLIAILVTCCIIRCGVKALRNLVKRIKSYHETLST